MVGFVRNHVAAQQFGPATLPIVYTFSEELAEFAVRARIRRSTWAGIFQIGGPVAPSREDLWRLIGTIVEAMPLVPMPPVGNLTKLRLEAEQAGDRARAMRLAREEVAVQLDLPAPNMAATGALFGGGAQRNLSDWVTEFL